MHVLFALQTAFSLWMLVDAAKRGAGYIWYLIIMMPFGEIAYFLAVKVHDPSFAAFQHRLFHRPPSLDQLRLNAEQIPSVENRLMLGRALHDAGRHSEAIPLFRQLLDQDPEDKAALYGLASSLLESGETSQAIDALEALAELDFKYANYGAGSLLAEIHWREERRDESVALLQKVASCSGRMGHQTQLARYLGRVGREQEAKALLERCLNEYAQSPRFARKKNRTQARAARSALKSLR